MFTSNALKDANIHKNTLFIVNYKSLWRFEATFIDTSLKPRARCIVR